MSGTMLEYSSPSGSRADKDSQLSLPLTACRYLETMENSFTYASVFDGFE